MKIFLDTAQIEDVKQWLSTGLIDGVTTNPTHLSKAQGGPLEVIQELCALLPHGEISVQVTEHEPEAVYNQARAIAGIAKNVLVKVPCHKDYYGVIQRLAREGIPLNITLVFNLMQSLAMCKLGVAYISPFVGRLDDLEGKGKGAQLLFDLRAMVDGYAFGTGILAASLRDTQQVHDALRAGVDAITVSSTVLAQAVTHQLTDQGIEIFNAAWAHIGTRKFP